jgi:hypothetical protein
LLFLLGLVAVLAPMATPADEAMTLNGQYVWNYQNEKPGDLEAVFTPAGEDKWDVAFHFEFNGAGHTYSGTAEGSLSEGKLEGKVQNEARKRTFTFTGAFEAGEFKGTHAELNSEGKPFDTGTLTLR